MGGVGQGPLLFLTRASGVAMFRGHWQEILSAYTGILRLQWEVSMPRPEVADAVRATCESILSARGVELVTFSLGRESVGQTLRLTVDRPGGTVSLGEIVEISEEVSKALDTEDPIPGRYTLEVASAGIERPLVRPADYRRFQGRRVKVRCEEPIEGQPSLMGSTRR